MGAEMRRGWEDFMLQSGMDYETLTRTFAWKIPQHFNIATAACERWAAAEPDRVAIIHVHADGRSEQVTYGALDRMANRILGDNWMPEYVHAANNGGIERVLV